MKTSKQGEYLKNSSLSEYNEPEKVPGLKFTLFSFAIIRVKQHPESSQNRDDKEEEYCPKIYPPCPAHTRCFCSFHQSHQGKQQGPTLGSSFLREAGKNSALRGWSPSQRKVRLRYCKADLPCISLTCTQISCRGLLLVYSQRSAEKEKIHYINLSLTSLNLIYHYSLNWKCLSYAKQKIPPAELGHYFLFLS